MKFSETASNGPMNKWLIFGGDPDHCLDTGIVFRIRHYWEIRKVVSTDCTVWCCSAWHALAGITIETDVMSSAHDRQWDWYRDTGQTCFVEVCTVPVLLFWTVDVSCCLCLCMWAFIRLLILISHVSLPVRNLLHGSVICAGRLPKLNRNCHFC